MYLIMMKSSDGRLIFVELTMKKIEDLAFELEFHHRIVHVCEETFVKLSHAGAVPPEIVGL